MTPKQLQRKTFKQIQKLTSLSKKSSEKRAKQHIKNEAIYRRIETAKQKIDAQFAEVTEKLLEFNKPSAETVAIGEFLSSVLKDPPAYGFVDTGEVMEKLVPLVGV